MPDDLSPQPDSADGPKLTRRSLLVGGAAAGSGRDLRCRPDRGVDVTEKAPQQRDIAMVFQNYALYPHMTVRDNLAYGLNGAGPVAVSA